MKHKDKKRLARSMLTREERETHVPIFQSKAWDKRNKAIARRIAKKRKQI